MAELKKSLGNTYKKPIEIQKKKLANVLKHFLDAHKIDEERQKRILDTFDNLGAIYCIFKAFYWGEAKEGFAFYQFLHYRWLYYLHKSHKIYHLLYFSTQPLKELDRHINCCWYSNYEYLSKPYTMFDYMRMLKRYKKIYENLEQRDMKDKF